MKAKTVKEKDHALEQAKAQLESIQAMVEALQDARKALEENESFEGNEELEKTEQAIQEDALSVEVRSAWHEPGKESEPLLEDYNILLCTGGPAVRVIGKLGGAFEPITARLEYQDWGTPWTEYRLTAEEEETVLKYARCFYYGE